MSPGGAVWIAGVDPLTGVNRYGLSRSQAKVMQTLHESRQNFPLLYVWIVDTLDGNYGLLVPTANGYARTITVSGVTLAGLEGLGYVTYLPAGDLPTYPATTETTRDTLFGSPIALTYNGLQFVLAGKAAT